MKLIVGLGNVGDRYTETRHNIGFKVINLVAEQLEATSWRVEAKFKAAVAEATIDDEKIILAKPGTMMNLSGGAVQRIMQFYKINLEDVLVIHDEVDLELGKLQLKQGGGSAGHNGVASVIDSVGANFWRLRCGVANEHIRNVIPTIDFVLQRFEAGEREAVDTMITTAAGQMINWLNQ
jgi:PTH1 family peptidyl-tRNA hydrolase